MYSSTNAVQIAVQILEYCNIGSCYMHIIIQISYKHHLLHLTWCLLDNYKFYLSDFIITDTLLDQWFPKHSNPKTPKPIDFKKNPIHCI